MTTKQRAALRSMCNTMEPVLQIGKDGITDNLVKQCWDALEARELIKVNVQKNAPYTARGLRGALRPRARRAGADHRQSLLDLSPGAGKLQDSP